VPSDVVIVFIVDSPVCFGGCCAAVVSAAAGREEVRAEVATKLAAVTRTLRREIFARGVPSISDIPFTSAMGWLIYLDAPECNIGQPGSNGGATFRCMEKTSRCSPKQRFQTTGKCENLPNSRDPRAPSAAPPYRMNCLYAHRALCSRHSTQPASVWNASASRSAGNRSCT
jgi:hypothetical protein